MAKRSRYFSLVFFVCVGAVFFTNPPARGEFIFTFFPELSANGIWGSSNSSLGLGGATVERFEDVNLAPGLTIALSGAAGGYGPTGTLPQVFNPNTDDPIGSIFEPGVWDGSNLLLNRGDNSLAGAASYSDDQWGDVTFAIDGGTQAFGISIQNLEAVTEIYVNNQSVGHFNSFLNPQAGRNGYLRITADEDVILSVTFDADSSRLNNLEGTSDGIAFDHLAFFSAIGHPADFDGDGDVDGDDFLSWQFGFNNSDAGDADGDGDTDGDDFLLWQGGFGSTFAGAAAASVPEPAALAVALVGLLFALFAAKSRRRAVR